MRVAVIGAGVFGLAMSVRLKQAGFDFTVFEKSDSPGGTWRDNTYPGCAVDTLSDVYSFTFLPYDWMWNYARQPEVLEYCEDIVKSFELAPHIRFGSEITSARWDEDAANYTVRTAGGESEKFDIVISAMGFLNIPNIPDWPGLSTFEGPVFHTFNWEHQHDFSTMRVAVVGTGSTAAQVVPALGGVAKELKVFQREPGWVFPKEEHQFTPEERRKRARPLQRRLRRHKIFYDFQKPSRLNGIHQAETKEQAILRANLEQFVRDSVKDPETAALLTPSYPVGCKRPVISADFLPTFNRDNVSLVPAAVSSVEPHAVIDVQGNRHELDAIVLSTGFQPSRYLGDFEIEGRAGLLSDAWQGEPAAFFGLSVPDFPNFFILYGPNTNGGVSAMANAERQTQAVIKTLKQMRRRDAAAVDTRRSAYDRFINWIDRENLKRTSADPKFCTSYFFAAGGRNVTQWPKTSRVYSTLVNLVWPAGLSMSGKRDALGPGKQTPRTAESTRHHDYEKAR